MVFQFNQIESPLAKRSQITMKESTVRANAACTLNAWCKCLFFSFLPLSLGKWNKLLRLIESGLPWGTRFNKIPCSGTVPSHYTEGTVVSLINTHPDWVVDVTHCCVYSFFMLHFDHSSGVALEVIQCFWEVFDGWWSVLALLEVLGLKVLAVLLWFCSDLNCVSTLNLRLYNLWLPLKTTVSNSQGKWIVILKYCVWPCRVGGVLSLLTPSCHLWPVVWFVLWRTPTTEITAVELN